LHSKKLPGRPDIVLVSRKIAIFVNGCFWHGHKNCAGAKLPASNTGFWREKLSGNAVRDKKNLILLREMGYKVITVWQCDLKSKVREKSLRSLVRKIRVSE
jgi:DNA mismatch endonuclease (patch repair protein)